VNDAFYPFGVPDQLQVALILCHAAQLSTPAEVTQALRMVREDAASILGLSGYQLQPGSRGDVVVLDAGTIEDALRYQAGRRWVVRGGRVVAEAEVRRVEPASPGA
jgi:cytosine deaminase